MTAFGDLMDATIALLRAHGFDVDEFHAKTPIDRQVRIYAGTLALEETPVRGHLRNRLLVTQFVRDKAGDNFQVVLGDAMQELGNVLWQGIPGTEGGYIGQVTEQMPPAQVNSALAGPGLSDAVPAIEADDSFWVIGFGVTEF